MNPFALFRRFLAAFRTPPELRAGALCWRPAGDDVEFLLITTRRSGRWTPPKGNRQGVSSMAESAAAEAWEEAGVRGDVGAKIVGEYDHAPSGNGARKIQRVILYPLRVRDLADDYPEAGRRKVRWADRETAASLVDNRELKRILRGFAPDF